MKLEELELGLVFVATRYLQVPGQGLTKVGPESFVVVGVYAPSKLVCLGVFNPVLDAPTGQYVWMDDESINALHLCAIVKKIDLEGERYGAHRIPTANA